MLFGLAVEGSCTVIVDMGSGRCKAGLAGERVPRSVISAIVGYPKFKLVMFGVRHKDCYIGEEAQAKRGILSLTYPMENGVVTCWDNMEKIWGYLYTELRMKPSERPALLTETPLNPLSHQGKLAKMMFESFQAPALFVTLQAQAALYASAHTTRLVLDSGDGVTVPIYKGRYLLECITRLDFAGRDVNKYLARLLLETGHSFVSTAEREIVRDIKERLCYVGLDPSQNMQENPKNLTCEYVLHDRRAVRAGDQLFQAPKALFAPAEVEIPGPGVGQMVFQSINECREHIQPDMLQNVLLAGGSTLFRGFKERLLNERETGVLNATHVKIISP
ncbi:LOW QUALITY PROTEIN: actin-related protein T2 [Pterocles gutturalis]